MVKGYLHIEIEVAQSSKKPGQACGDKILFFRDNTATTVLCIDGIGSGTRAHIASEMAAARLKELLQLNFSLHKAMDLMVRTMEKARDPAKPFAAITAARILLDGSTTVLSYEMPLPILITERYATVLEARPIQLGGTVISELNCWLRPDDSVLFMTDGITQAGIGQSLANGWETSGVLRYANLLLRDGMRLDSLHELIHAEARRLWRTGGDDCTAALLHARKGQVVNILTGPPAKREKDAEVVEKFIRVPGTKIVCGGKTAEVVAKNLGRELEVEQNPTSAVAPPRYRIEGINLVTEGAVTLTQVYNILDESVSKLEDDSGVTEFRCLLEVADRVNVFLGGAENEANEHILFRQRGILSRQRIVPLIAEKLRQAGKLVVINHV